MRGDPNFQGKMFSYISREDHVPQSLPLGKLPAVIDALLATMNIQFEALYLRLGCLTVPSEMLLKPLLLQMLFSIRIRHQLVEAVNYNLLSRWLAGFNIEDQVWDQTTFTANRERLFKEDLARAFFERVNLNVQSVRLASDEHFSVDNTLIEDQATYKSFKRRVDDCDSLPSCNTAEYFNGQQFCNDTNATGTVEPEPASALLKLPSNKHTGATVDDDLWRESKAFVKACRRPLVMPQLGAKANHSAVDERIKRHDRYKISRKVRSRIGATFCRHKRVGGVAKTPLIGQAKHVGRALLCIAGSHLVRLGAIGDLWDGHHA